MAHRKMPVFAGILSGVMVWHSMAGCLPVGQRNEVTARGATGDQAVVKTDAGLVQVSPEVGSVEAQEVSVGTTSIGGGGDSVTAWIYALTALAGVFYPMVIRPIRKRWFEQPIQVPTPNDVLASIERSNLIEKIAAQATRSVISQVPRPDTEKIAAEAASRVLTMLAEAREQVRRQRATNGTVGADGGTQAKSTVGQADSGTRADNGTL